MMPRFYFAVGARPRRRDLEVAALVGQTDLLVPAGSAAARLVRYDRRFAVVLDSWAWPPHNPDRLSLHAYWQEVQTWRERDGSWRCDWFAAYDTIGDPCQSQRDYRTLLTLMTDSGGADAPLVPVTHYPGPAVDAILLDLQLGHAGMRDDLVDGAGLPDRPGYAIGGLVPARYSTHADWWYGRLLVELEALATDTTDDAALLDADVLRLHLFGVGKPAWVHRSPLVQSFDSSGPAIQASFGWKQIAPRYCAQFGLSPAKLTRSREARLAYWIMAYRAACTLPARLIDEDAVLDDDEVLANGRPARQLRLCERRPKYAYTLSTLSCASGCTLDCITAIVLQ